VRNYETLVILSDLLEEEAALELFDDVKQLFVDNGGEVRDDAWWGKRKLQHLIHKRDHAWYAVVDHTGTPEGVAETERRLKINDDVWRFKTVRPELRVHRA